ncbi:unnamed protein product [Alopecurus aequalis]
MKLLHLRSAPVLVTGGGGQPEATHQPANPSRATHHAPEGEQDATTIHRRRDAEAAQDAVANEELGQGQRQGGAHQRLVLLVILHFHYSKGKNGNGEAGGNRDKPDDAEITGETNTEPSYMYIKRDHEEVGDKEEDEFFEETMTSSSSPSFEETDTTVKESPSANGAEPSPRDSSESMYSKVQSSFSHGLEFDTSAACSPFRTPPPSNGALSTEELLEDDAAMLRMKWEQEEEDADDQSIVFLPSTCCTTTSGAVSIVGRLQSPIDAVAGGKN